VACFLISCGECVVSVVSVLLLGFFVVVMLVMRLCVVHELLLVFVGCVDDPLTGLCHQVFHSMCGGNITDVFVPRPISQLLCHWVALSWRNLLPPVFVVPALPA